MKHVFRIIAGACLSLLLTLQPASTAKAEPLTIIAIAGFSLVAAAGAYDAALVHHNDNKDMRAQMRERNPNRDEIAPVAQTNEPDLGYFARNGHVADTGGVAVGASDSVHGYFSTGVPGSSGD